jgi:hypothetical protein
VPNYQSVQGVGAILVDVTHCSRNEVGIVAVRCVPVASVEDADGLVVDCRERLEILDEAVLIIDLQERAVASVPR